MKPGRKTAANALTSTIARIREERDEYAKKIAEIDALFAEVGIDPSKIPASNGEVDKQKPARATRKHKKRGHFDVPGPESVMAFVGDRRTSGATSKEITSRWKDEGRSGEPYVVLGQLVQAGKLKKKPEPGTKGSRYFLRG